MILKIFGLLDMFAAIVLLLLKFNMGIGIAWFFAIYLIIKSLLLFNAIPSILDLLSAIIIILAIYSFYGIFSYLAILWLLQKGFFSLLS